MFNFLYKLYYENFDPEYKHRMRLNEQLHQYTIRIKALKENIKLLEATYKPLPPPPHIKELVGNLECKINYYTNEITKIAQEQAQYLLKETV